MTESEILSKIKESYQTILGEKLVGIYVHGSIAFECFVWNKSDIDFIVVVNEKLSTHEKEALIGELLMLDKDCPPKGLEMSVVLGSVCNPFVYPTPYELHFSNSHKAGFQEDLAGYAQKMNGIDKDLAAHFTVIRTVGRVLCGAAISEVFGDVPREDYLDSICEDIKDAKPGAAENPVYYILNLCRGLAYIEEGVVISKKQGGEWGMKHLPKKFVPIVRKALDSYCEDAVFKEAAPTVWQFVSYMLERLGM